MRLQMNFRHASIHIRSRTRLLAGTWLGLFALTSRVWAVDYHLSPSGNDANDGRTPATAWRTIGKANAFALQPGDRMLFEGGAHFEGTLSLDGSDGGDP
jgi:hypothetical protein